MSQPQHIEINTPEEAIAVPEDVIEDEPTTQGILIDLLRSEGIQKVIWVDDVHTPEDFNTAEILTLLQKLEEGDIPEEITDSLGPDPYRYDIESLEGVFFAMDSERRAAVLLILQREYAELDTEEKDARLTDHMTADVMTRLFKDDVIKLEFVDPKEWDKCRDKLITDETRALILLDWDLGRSGLPTGDNLLVKAKRMDTNSRLEFALVTHTAEPDTEEDRTIELTQALNVEPDEFVVISKATLTQESDRLLARLGMAFMTRWTREIKTLALDKIVASNRSALEEMKLLTVQDFDYIVFGLSEKEGSFEFDTIFRLFSIMSRSHARVGFYSSSAATALLEKARLRRKDILSSSSPQKSKLKTIQRKEFYEDLTHLNSQHRPLDTGDIFENTVDGRKFVLVTAPCDLSIRGEGLRNKDVCELLLAEIFSNSSGKVEKTKKDKVLKDPEKFYELKYLDEDSDERYWVNFRAVYSINPMVLDLCAHNKDGIAKTNMDSQQMTSLPKNINEQRAILDSYFKKSIQERHSLSAILFNEEILDRLLPVANPNFAVASFDQQAQSIVYGFKRIGRLMQPYASEMLLKFAIYRSRMGFERDIAS